MNRRAQLFALVAIGLVGLLRGGWWVAVTEVWSPIDEVAHADYVVSMATELEPPEVGRDRVRDDLLELAKDSATSPWRPSPLTADNDDLRWGALAQSYEGVQPPLYYAVLAPAWKLLHGYGTLTMLYVERALTLLMAVAAVPFLWLLGRELFPERPEVGLGAGALLVSLGGVNANLATVGNDALVMTLGTATLWLVARTWNRGFKASSAIAVGVLVGLTVLSKTTGLVIIPLVALGALGPLWTRGVVARRYVAWGAQAGAAAAVVVAPWLLWNRATYGAWSASEPVDKITGPLQPPIPRSLYGLWLHLKSAVQAFWGSQLAVPNIGNHAIFWTAAGFAILLAAVVFHLRRWRPNRDAFALAWLASAVPLALLMMIVIIAGVFGGSSSVVGRHLYAGLPPLLLAISAALSTMVGRRITAVVLATLIAVGFTLERADTNRYVRGTYTRGVMLGLTPVAGQGRGDQAVAGPLSVHLEADCAIGGVSVEFAERAGDVGIRRGDEPAVPSAPKATRADAGGGVFAYFAIQATSRAVNVEIPQGAQVAAGVPDRGDTLVPVAFAYCDEPDAADARFAALFHPQHPDWSRAATLAWPKAWVILGWLGVGAALIAASRKGRRADHHSP